MFEPYELQLLVPTLTAQIRSIAFMNMLQNPDMYPMSRKGYPTKGHVKDAWEQVIEKFLNPDDNETAEYIKYVQLWGVPDAQQDDMVNAYMKMKRAFIEAQGDINDPMIKQLIDGIKDFNGAQRQEWLNFPDWTEGIDFGRAEAPGIEHLTGPGGPGGELVDDEGNVLPEDPEDPIPPAIPEGPGLDLGGAGRERQRAIDTLLDRLNEARERGDDDAVQSITNDLEALTASRDADELTRTGRRR